MPSIEPRVVPDDYYSFNLKNLDTFLLALERRMAAKEVMHIGDAAKFMGCSVRKINDLCQRNKIPYHRIDGLAGKLFLRSELIEFFKKH